MAPRLTRAAVFSIPSTVPFADALAAYVLAQHAQAPETLARTRILLPSRRACASVREALIQRLSGRPMLLPSLRALEDVEDEALFPAFFAEAEAAVALPPAMPAMKRHALMTRLVARLPGVQHTAQAARLATELLRLQDAALREDLSLDALETLAPAELAAHWQQTLDFLRVLHRHWPAVLQEHGEMEAAARRNRLFDALAAHWQRTPPEFPVIAAGSTGSHAATARLLSAIAHLPRGAVILPGLDHALDAEAWKALGPAHPQYGLRALLAAMEMGREAVQVLHPAGVEEGCDAARADWLRCSMLPAAHTALWRTHPLQPEAALRGVQVIPCVTQRQEAAVVALQVREALETPGKTVCVVTPDRSLARMIAAALQRFHITVDDSAGRPVLHTRAGNMLRLLAEAAETRAAPVPLLALLKHPLVLLSMPPAACREAARELERAVLRGVRAGEGLEAMAEALAACAEDIPTRQASALLAALSEAVGPWFALMRQPQASFAALLEAHLHAAEALAGPVLWQGEDGTALAHALTELSTHAPLLGSIEPVAYARVLEEMLAPVVHRPVAAVHPRVRMLSPVEARMQRADLMMLVGMNAGVWPQEVESSPWMNRSMMAAFGLPPPERSVGMAAHDVVQLASTARQVVFTYAGKIRRQAAAPSPFLLRLRAVLSASVGADYAWPETPYPDWAKDATLTPAPPAEKPRARPPVSARPKALSVTEIETWREDAYVIYARHVLSLEPLDALDRLPDAREFGSVVHKAMEQFALRYAEALPADVEAALRACGEDAFAALHARPVVRAYWLPRFHRIVPWLAAQEQHRRRHAAVRAECKGSWKVEGFTLSTRIDRLDVQGADARIVDYKTGGMPTLKEISTGRKLQLPLEACVLLHGNVQGAAGVQRVSALEYWKLAGAKPQRVWVDGDAAQAAILQAEQILRAHIKLFAEENTPYEPAAKAPTVDTYGPLVRREEWAETNAEEEGYADVSES